MRTTRVGLCCFVSALLVTGASSAATAAEPIEWGLDRIDQSELPLDGTYTPPHAGGGVNVYVIDTGIRASHVEFGDRVKPGFAVDGGDTDDCWGHGTGVASLAGGAGLGAAPETTLWSVRAVPCEGRSADSTQDMIKSLDWVAQNAQKPAVVNLSMGAESNPELDAAAQRVIDAGITLVVAAGNGDDQGNGIDACGQSPARVPDAITVGASNREDKLGSFSNFGSCVDIVAPGVDVGVAGIGSDTEVLRTQGTSEAAPLVAGVAAQILGANPGASPAEVGGALVDSAADTLTGDLRNTPNRLLQVAAKR